MTPDRVLLVYDADHGLAATLVDVVKKALGREDCALCEITHGAVGKREAWRRCEAALPVPVVGMHRDEVPAHWLLPPLPCVVAQRGGDDPVVLVDRAAIEALRSGGAHALADAIRAALALGMS